jgi:hypothetical protein
VKLAGLIIASVGAITTWVVGHNYTACQSFWVQINSNDSAACHAADVAHPVGILVLVIGALVFGIGLLIQYTPRSER